MADLGFGQSYGGIMQMAYVVADLDAAIDHWVRDLNVGPWFVLDRWTGDHPVYRGAPATGAVRLAMSFAGHMNVELIQPLDDEPSVYREGIERRGHGFHHFGIACRDIDAGIADYRERGYELAFRAGVPTGGDVAYLDGGAAQPGYVELINANAGMDAAFTGFWQATRNWDGRDPMRPFA